MNDKKIRWLLIYFMCWLLPGTAAYAKDGSHMSIQEMEGGMLLQAREVSDWEGIAFRLLYRKNMSEKEEEILSEKDLVWEENQGIYFSEILLETEGIYEAELLMSDSEGNRKEHVHLVKTVDHTKPEAACVSFIAGETKLEPINETVYSRTETQIHIRLTDEVGGLKQASLWLQREGMQTEEHVFAWDEPVLEAELELTVPESGTWKFGVETEDTCGNRTDGIVWLGNLLIETAEPQLQAAFEGKEGAHGFYCGDVCIQMKAEDAQSGLKRMTLMANERVIRTWEAQDPGEVLEGSEYLNAEIFEGETKIRICAEDRAGNISEFFKEVKIDTKPPEIEWIFRPQQAVNGMYYTKARKARLRIKETWFEDADTEIWNEGMLMPPISFTETEEDCYEAEIIFEKDGRYEIEIRCTDLAGNQADPVRSELFVVDQTRPVLEVHYEDEKEDASVFGMARKAKICIWDANQDPEAVDIQIRKNGKRIDPKDVGAVFIKNEKGISGTVTLDQEGVYEWSVQARDLAGNESAVWKSGGFVIDLTKPQLELKGIQSGASLREEVSFLVTAKDRSIPAESLKAELYRDGTRIAHTFERKEQETEQMLIFDAVPKERSFDGHYVLTAVCEDEAGNCAEERWTFTVNRYGSVLRLGEETETAKKEYYRKEVPEISITERNLDALTDQDIMLCDEKGLRLLEKGKDYAVMHTQDEKGWHSYRYQIRKHVFETDGVCELSIHTKDRAGNVLDSREEYPIRFFLDREGPEIDFEKSEDSNEIMIRIRGKSPVKRAVFWLNGERSASYDQTEIEAVQGQFRLYPGKSEYKQCLSVEALDAAGNHTVSKSLVFQNGDILPPQEEDAREEEKEMVPGIRADILAGFLLLFVVTSLMIVHFGKRKKKNGEDPC